jgi:PleD family two-component response regulator
MHRPGSDQVDLVLHKPVTGSSLTNAVARLIHEKREHVEPLRVGQRRLRLPGVHILLVDDSDINLEVATRLLQREGAEVITAIDGSGPWPAWQIRHGASIWCSWTCRCR